ncbi:MAG TPA: DUF1592 domain-containing protein [Polyangia bacterium]|nr:DUF1592 domain-containing protein [Polyangia bacterium]
METPVSDLWTRFVRPSVLLAGGLAALLLAGCNGRIDDAAGGGTGATTGSAGNSGAPGDPKAAGVLPLRRLTAREYLNTARDLLGDTTLDSGDVPSESDDLSNNAFPFRQPGAIGNFEAGNLQSAAETLASHLATKLSSVLPCTPANSGAEAGCANQFITTFGAKVFRRPLSTTEVADLTAMYQTGRATLGLDFNGAIDLLIETMLQSPQFVYHWEMDPGPAVKDGNVVQLGNYQIANRLSYFLWGTMPDAALFAAAAAGQLTTTDGLQTQIQRMLTDPKAADMAADFFDDWLDVNVLSSRPKDATLYPMWNQDLATAMENEFRAFGSSVLTGSGSFADLLTGTSTSVNQALAAVYKVGGVTGTTPKPVTLDGTQRSGLLTLAGFLTVTGASDGSSPVRRGHAIYTRLLCNVLPNPPNNVPPPQPPTPGLTTRDRFLQHDQNSCTGACHNAMDPIGYGFENYDGIGQFRTTDQNLPVDASGQIQLNGSMQTFPDAVALTKMLASSPDVQSCFARQWTRYALNRWDTSADLASVQAAAKAFQTSGDMRDLIAAVATSRTFRYRAPAAGEVLP